MLKILYWWLCVISDFMIICDFLPDLPVWEIAHSGLVINNVWSVILRFCHGILCHMLSCASRKRGRYKWHNSHARFHAPPCSSFILLLPMNICKFSTIFPQTSDFLPNLCFQQKSNLIPWMPKNVNDLRSHLAWSRVSV